MLTLTDAQINALIGQFLWPFVRISGILLVDPVYASHNVPRTWKLGLALVLCIVLVPVLPSPPVIALVSAEGVWALLQQLLIGISMGFVMRLVMGAVELAGTLIANQMGLGFAMMYDPQSATQSPAVSTFLSMFVTLLFLTFNGHQVILSTLIDSFRVLPVGQGVPAITWKLLADWASHVFSWGLWLSLPVIAALMVTNLAIGVMTRAAPQFNILSFGFPLTLSIGFVSLYLTLPMMVPLIEHFYLTGFHFMLQMLTGKPG